MNSQKEDKTKKISIFGAGSWGTTLALLATRAGSEVLLYDRNHKRVEQMKTQHENTKYLPNIKLPRSIQFTSDLKELFEFSSYVLIAIPSKNMRESAQHFSPYTRGDHLLVHGIKGLEPHLHKRMSEILIEETGVLRIGVLSGPNLSQELAEGLPGATVIASRFQEVLDETKNFFSSDQFKVVGSTDLKGVEWIGALKNIIALSSGILEHLNLGQNAKAFLMTEQLHELSLILNKLEADKETLWGLAGIGDIFATSTSPKSRNYQAGIKIAQGVRPEKVEDLLQSTVEGIHTVQVAFHFAKNFRLHCPWIEVLNSILFQNLHVKEGFELFLRSH